MLLEDLDFGGTQRYAINLLKHLDRRLFSPELWILRGGTDMVPMAMGANIKMIWLSRASFVNPWALIHLMVRLIRCNKQILYTLTVIPNIWGRIFGKIAKVPVIASGYRSLLPKQYEKWLWPLSNRIICNASILKKIMVKRYSVESGRVAIIPNAVDTELFYPFPEQKSQKPTMLFVGRLVPEKAPMDLLKAFSRLIFEFPEARLEIVGNGPLRNSLADYIRSQSLASQVRIIPSVRDIRPFFNRAWIFAMASILEASPNVIIEAMASGLPVVATRVGGIPELVDDGQTGLLVESGDPDRLASALKTLIVDKQKRRTMGIKAREKVLASYTLDKMVRRTEEVLVEAMNGDKH